MSSEVTLETRLNAALDSWKRKLLDLTKRNRALNFRPTRASTIGIVDEQPAEVFRYLYLQEKSMKFSPAQAVTPDKDADAEAVALPSEAYVPYERKNLQARHTDDTLQTNLSPEHLDRSLRRLSELATSTIEEQGVSTLFLALGMLHYAESPASEEIFKAPLILLPVQLVRDSARMGYRLKIGDEDPVVNPALVEYLRRSMGLQMPEIPDPETMADDYDLQIFLTALTDRIKDRPLWSVTNDIVLGQFSFQKLVMYKDLETNSSAVLSHKLVRQIVGRSGDHVAGLPDEIREMRLDESFKPEVTLQVVDADSSQLRALAAVSRNYDLVMEGPPGTGKSQTITNLIASSLAEGKSILFVCEKMAALQVVHSRLAAAGLDEFCLELHSSKGNKRLVMQNIAAALDASLQRTTQTDSPVGRLAEVRETLTAYANSVHSPLGRMEISPYTAFGEFSRVIGATKFPLEKAIDDVTRDQLRATVRDLDDLSEHAKEIGSVAEHPWRDSTRTIVTEDDLDTLDGMLRESVTRLTATMDAADAASAAFDLGADKTFEDVDRIISIGRVLGKSPGAPASVLESDTWNVPPAEAVDVIRRGREFTILKNEVNSRFNSTVLGRNHTDDIAYMERVLNGPFSFLAILRGRYREIKRRWMAYRRPSYTARLLDQVTTMKKVGVFESERNLLAAEVRGRDLFGSLWNGADSSWDDLDAYVKWVVEFRKTCVQDRLSTKVVAAASRAKPDIQLIEKLAGCRDTAMEALNKAQAFLGWPKNYFNDVPIETIVSRLQKLQEAIDLGPAWCAFEVAHQKASAGVASEFVTEAFSGRLPFTELSQAFQRAFYQKWISAAVQQRSELLRFSTMSHEQRVQEFRRLDRELLQYNRTALVAKLRASVQDGLRTPEALAALPFLKKELARQRRFSPLRKTLHQSEAAIRAIKPCFMMSPLTVAQYLKGAAPTFDLVVFDEASQLPTEDSVGAVIRGRQLVVVGDSKQLPPTNFFAVMGGQAEETRSADGEILFEDSESILEEFMASGAARSRLKWHYRSSHESLINFSNVSFYDSELYTFPSVEIDSQKAGLQFEFVEGGIYEGAGINRVEAKRVVDAVLDHARNHPELSLGVGTFNLRQQIAILDELEFRRREDPSTDAFFAKKEQDGFFVKNLENIQGDERDVIFLSVTYAKAQDGKLRYNFGPLNAQNGWRRLNVLTTRARKHMRVFSSIHSNDIQVAETASLGAKLLHDFLAYAEYGRLDNVRVAAAPDLQALLEADIYQELTKRGLKLVPHVGVAGYRIDFGVLHDSCPGRFACGLECDGVSYHASETARDRDRLRQQVLENRGWIMHRIWSTDWFKDRKGQIERVVKLVSESAAQMAARREENEALVAAAAAPPVAAAPHEPVTMEYVRPEVPLYEIAPGQNRYKEDLLEASDSLLRSTLVSIVKNEFPIHIEELIGRMAGVWGQRAGSKISARIEAAVADAAAAGEIAQRGEFIWMPKGAVVVRSRAEVRMSADRIAPEEYREAVLLILRSGGTFQRSELTGEVRALMGFSRTGTLLEKQIKDAIDYLMQHQVIGEASKGIVLR